MDKIHQGNSSVKNDRPHSSSADSVGMFGRFKATIGNMMQRMRNIDMHTQPSQHSDNAKELSDRSALPGGANQQTALDLAYSLSNLRGDDLINSKNQLKELLFKPNMPILTIAQKLASDLSSKNQNSESKNTAAELLSTIVKNKLGEFEHNDLHSVYDLLKNNGAEDLGEYSSTKSIAMGRWKRWD